MDGIDDDGVDETIVAPADDPGWNYVTTGGRNMVYLGNGWILSAFHVGAPSPTESLVFNGSSFNVIGSQGYVVKNTLGQGLTTDTDLRMFRINGDPGLPAIRIASQQLFETAEPSTPTQEVVIIGNGPTRQLLTTKWNVTQNSAGADSWTEAVNGSYEGYKSVQPSDNVKRWGTNRIADEDCLFGSGSCTPNSDNNEGGDDNLRGVLKLTLGVGQRDIESMVTRFDANGLANEAQVVAGDSGSGVFYKRNGAWELIGIVNSQLTGIRVNNQFLDGQSTLNAVYGNFTSFADLTYYRSNVVQMMDTLRADVNLDGVLTGGIAGGIPTGDIAAFVAGWGYNNGTGAGNTQSWISGDLNSDGKTNYLDFVIMRAALNTAGIGGSGAQLESLLGLPSGVPEPSSAGILLIGLTWLAVVRCGRWRK